MHNEILLHEDDYKTLVTIRKQNGKINLHSTFTLDFIYCSEKMNKTINISFLISEKPVNVQIRDWFCKYG